MTTKTCLCLIGVLAWTRGVPAHGNEFVQTVPLYVAPSESQEQSETRRQLAMKTAASGTYIDFQKALKLLEKNADADGVLAHRDLVVWLHLAVKRTERSSHLEAMRLVDGIATRRALTDDELFMKELLGTKIGDPERWQEAKRIFSRLLQRAPTNQSISQAYARELIRHEEFADVLRLGKILSPTMRLRAAAHIEAKNGRKEKATELLIRVRPVELKTRQQQRQLVALAAIAEELGKYDSAFYGVAQEQLALLAKVVPHEFWRLTRSRGVHGVTATVKSALETCMEEEHDASDSVRAGIAIEILRKHKSKWDGALKQELAGVGTWLTDRVKKAPKDTVLRWRLAEYHDMIGNLELATKAYQSLLNSGEIKNPIERGMLLNNFAYTASLQGDCNELHEMIREVKELLGPTAEVLDTEGFVYYSLGQHVEAVALFRKAISESPSAQKFFHLTLALDKLEDSSAQGTWQAAMDAGLESYGLPRRLRDEFDRIAAKYGERN